MLGNGNFFSVAILGVFLVIVKAKKMLHCYEERKYRN